MLKRKTPSANIPANTTPMAVSSRRLPRRLIQPIASAVADGRDRRAEVERPLEQVGDDDARERRVAQRVAHEREPAQHHVRADDRADDPDHGRRQQGAYEELVASGSVIAFIGALRVVVVVMVDLAVRLASW